MTVPNTIKFLRKIDDKVYKFDKNLHRWVELCNFTDLSTTHFSSNGITYTELNTTYNTVLLSYTETETLSDGSKVYESETITPDMNVSALDETTLNDNDYLVCTVPGFTPKSLLNNNEELICYTGSEAPYIESAISSLTNVHKEDAIIKVVIIASWNQTYKIGGKINNNSLEEINQEINNSYKELEITIPNNYLILKENNLILKSEYTGSMNYSREQTFNSIIYVINNSPNIEIANDESDNKIVVFKLLDSDNDNVSFEIGIKNSIYKEEEIVSKWSPFDEASNISGNTFTYLINTDYVVPDEENTIIIHSKDNFDETDIKIGEYKFIGKYNKLVISDGRDESYLCNDNKVTLKILDAGMIPAGFESDVIPVIITNNKNTQISNVVIESIISEMAPGSEVVYSKSDNPFIENKSLNYDNIKANSEEVFYMKIKTKVKELGTCLFKIGIKGDDI